MLDYLVTSSVRRRMLELLWRQGARGSASELAERAHVAFAAAYRELSAMRRQGLAASAVQAGVERFWSAQEHPDADLVRRLVEARPRTYAPRADDDELVQRKMRALGAPLPVERAAVSDAELEQSLVEAVRAARHDPTLATVLPVVLWRQRDRFDRVRLEREARHAKQKHAVGFMLALTAELAGDRKLARVAEGFRDGRVKRVRPFFELATTRSAERTAERRTPALAREWGYALDLDLESLRQQFDKFGNDGPI
jgi:hypothetical protein